jgi:hypothetical protein
MGSGHPNLDHPSTQRRLFQTSLRPNIISASLTSVEADVLPWSRRVASSKPIRPRSPASPPELRVFPEVDRPQVPDVARFRLGQWIATVSVWTPAEWGRLRPGDRPAAVATPSGAMISLGVE